MVASEISYVVLFGVISFTNAKPGYGQDAYNSEPQHDLKKLLELFKQGNEDNIMLNHQEDRPGTHHEDTIQLTYNGGKHGKQKSHYYNDKHHNEQYDSSHLQSLLEKNIRYNKQPSPTNIHNLYLFNKKKSKKPAEDVDDSNPLNKILNTLNVIEDINFDDNINEDDNYDGNRNYNQNNNNDIGNNDRDNEYNGLRIIKNDDNRDNSNVQHCIGDKCGRNLNNDENIDYLHCIGESCGNKNSIKGDRDNDRDDTDDDIKDRHHHRDDRHYVRDDRFRQKNDRDDDRAGRHHHRDDRDYVMDDENVERDNGNNARENLRCSRGRCNRDDRNDEGYNGNDDSDNQNNDRDNLRCSNGRCSRDDN